MARREAGIRTAKELNGGTHRETRSERIRSQLGGDFRIRQERGGPYVPGPDEQADADGSPPDDALEPLRPCLVDVLVLECSVCMIEQPHGAVLEGGQLGGSVPSGATHLGGQLGSELESARSEVVYCAVYEVLAVLEGFGAPCEVGAVSVVDDLVEVSERARVLPRGDDAAVDRGERRQLLVVELGHDLCVYLYRGWRERVRPRATCLSADDADDV